MFWLDNIGEQVQNLYSKLFFNVKSGLFKYISHIYTVQNSTDYNINSLSPTYDPFKIIVKPTLAVTSINQSPVSKGHLFLDMS
jgi:hypothetical protein